MAKALLLDFGSVISKSLLGTLSAIENLYGLKPGKFAWSGPFGPEKDWLGAGIRADRLSERTYHYTRSQERSALARYEQKIIDIIQKNRDTGLAEDFIRSEAGDYGVDYVFEKLEGRD